MITKLIFCLTVGFPLGLVLGSYAACMGYRLPRKISTWGRSECPKCHHTLGWIDLLPVLGYLIRGRKCAYCSAEISPMYTYIELLSGCVVATFLWIFGPTPLWIKYVVLSTGLLVACVSDKEHFIIPDKLIFCLAVLAIPLTLWVKDISLIISLTGGLVGFYLFRIPSLILKKLPGGGDIKLLAVIGLYLGPGGLALTVLGGCVAAVASCGLKNLKKEIPLGPFLCFGGILTMIFK